MTVYIVASQGDSYIPLANVENIVAEGNMQDLFINPLVLHNHILSSDSQQFIEEEE